MPATEPGMIVSLTRDDLRRSTSPARSGRGPAKAQDTTERTIDRLRKQSGNLSIALKRVRRANDGPKQCRPIQRFLQSFHDRNPRPLRKNLETLHDCFSPGLFKSSLGRRNHLLQHANVHRATIAPGALLAHQSYSRHVAQKYSHRNVHNFVVGGDTHCPGA
jgi:hypothetical protein